MEELGIIGEDERVELLGGQLYIMTIKPPHAMVVAILAQKLAVAFDGRAQVSPQNPLRLSDELDDTELPQPDVMLLKNTFYLDHPRPEDVYLLIEVSDSTLKKDQQLKLPQVGIPEVWLVNLPQQRLEVYLDPQDEDYAKRSYHPLTATLAPSAFPDDARQWLPDEVYRVLEQN